MVKKSGRKKLGDGVAPADENQNGSESASSDTKKVSKADAVRAALKEGVHKPQDAVQFIRDRFGIEIPPGMFSSYKSMLGKKKGESRSDKKTSGGGVDLASLEVVKELIDKLGGDTVKRLVDVLG